MKTIRPWVLRVMVSLCLFDACLAAVGALAGKGVAWGNNDFSQANVPTGLSNLVAVAGGEYHSLALQSNGTIVAWGYNGDGEITTPPGFSNVVAVAAGGWHSLALQSNGTVVAWGSNLFGQTNTPSALINAVAIAGGYYHSLALQNSGTVTAWGYNSDGQTTVPSGLNGVVAIGAGYAHSLALRANGTVVAWGANYFGEATVPAGLSNVVAIAAGGWHNLALRSNGTVVAWGYNTEGEATVPPGLSNVVAVAAGGYHNLALRRNGTVVAWGAAGDGETAVPSALSNVVAIAGGGKHSLAISPGPTISSQPPPAMSFALKASTNLNVTVWSGIPFTCQWWFNGSPIAGATRTSLPIINFDLTKAGAYSLVVSNQFGLATASSVLRVTNSPVVLVDGIDVGGGTMTRINSSQVTMSSLFGLSAHIYYTLDGSDPDFTALPYSGAVTLTNSATVRAIAYNSAYTGWSQAAPIYVQVCPTYLLSASTTEGGRINVSPAPYAAGNLYLSNTIVTLTATPSNGWLFAGWAGDSTATTSVTTVVMDQPRTVQALFQAWETYPLSASTPGGGSISVSPTPYAAGNLYLSNTIVTLTAHPSNGLSFIGWTGDSSATTNVTTVLMDQPHEVKALFGTALNLFTNGSGQVLLDPPTGPYLFGATVQLKALASPGYYFFGWSGAASGFANPLQITVTNAAGITALFGALKTNQVLLTVAPSPNGNVLLDPVRNVYTIGDTVTLTALPANNYTFIRWGGDTSGNSNPLVLSLTSNTLVTARFDQPPVFQSVVQIADALAFTWSAVTGRTYQVQYATHLFQTSDWSNLGNASIATNDTMSASDPVGPDPQRFYRITLLP